MKKTYTKLQVHEMMDVLWFYQASLQLKKLHCNQLAHLFEQYSNHKLQCAMHLHELDDMNVEMILVEASKIYERDYQHVYCESGIDKKQEAAIRKIRKEMYLQCIDLLHDCVNQTPLKGYQCIQCGYRSSHLDEHCPICHNSQSYFMKQE